MRLLFIESLTWNHFEKCLVWGSGHSQNNEMKLVWRARWLLIKWFVAQGKPWRMPKDRVQYDQYCVVRTWRRRTQKMRTFNRTFLVCTAKFVDETKKIDAGIWEHCKRRSWPNQITIISNLKKAEAPWSCLASPSCRIDSFQRVIRYQADFFWACLI